jgi:hypothetical protein
MAAITRRQFSHSPAGGSNVKVAASVSRAWSSLVFLVRMIFTGAAICPLKKAFVMRKLMIVAARPSQPTMLTRNLSPMTPPPMPLALLMTLSQKAPDAVDVAV